MSMITGCPACGTLFKVVPDQLKISDGWVRCGHCGEVFDAAASMQPAAPATVSAAEPAETAVPPVPAPAEPAATTAPAALPADAPQDGERIESTQTVPEPQVPASLLSRRDDGADVVDVDFVHSGFRASAPSRVDFVPSAADAEDEAVEQVSFVREARRKALWRRPLVRVALALAALALAALLAGQVALHDRDRIAATQPQWRPMLEQACARLGCAIGPPRRIEAIAIDSSGFAKLRPDTYRLSFTLKNHAAQPVAVPSLELTLTDTQDQPLLRRVLSPREMGAPTDTIGATSEWSSSLAIAVSTDATSSRITGYRLLAFYP